MSESLAVIGVGGVGTNVIQICKSMGVYPIIAIDINDEKLENARKLGATHVINSTKMNVKEAIHKITNGGVDCCIEALGHPQTFYESVHAVKDGGRSVIIGIADVTLNASIPITHIVRRKIQILGSFGAKAPKDMPEIIKLSTSGVIDVKKSITHRYSLNDAEQALRDLEAGRITGRAIIDLQDKLQT